MPQPQAGAPASSIRDAFISYASEDKEVAQALTDALAALGLSIWFDDYELRVGDSLSRKIDKGLRISRCGIVILSNSFFAKNWPRSELGGLKALEKQILPVWHEINADEVKVYSPTLADIRATKTILGLDTKRCTSPLQFDRRDGGMVIVGCQRCAARPTIRHRLLRRN